MDFSQLTGSTLGLVVVLVVAGFAVGNFMAARPRAGELRTADLRLLARQLRLYPKLVTPPDWLEKPAPKAEKSDIYARQTTPMLTQYSLVMDELTLPAACYVPKQGAWQVVAASLPSSAKLAKKASALVDLPVDLPVQIAPHVQGLQIKANSISIYWKDEKYQEQKQAHKLDQQLAKEDLMALKAALEVWAHRVQNH